MKGLIRALSNRTPLGFLQLKHDKAKLLTALAGVAFADILILMQLGFLNALFDSSVKPHQSLNADLIMMNTEALNWTEMSTFARRRLYQAMDVPGVASVESIYINNIRWKNPQTGQKSSVIIIGINPDGSVLDLPEVNKNLDKIKLPDTFLFDRGSRGEYKEIIAQAEAGEKLTTEIERRTITVEGLFTLGASFGADATLISSEENFLRLFPKKNAGTVSVGLIKLKPSADPTTVKNSLNAYFEELKDVRVVTLDEFIALEKAYWGGNRPIGIVFSFSMVIGFIVGVVIVYQVLSTDVNDHISEYATFKAMGYRNAYLLGIVFEEAIILAVLGFVPGVVVSFGLYYIARKATYLPMYITISRAVGVLILTIVMCSISGAIATRKLQSTDPADIF